MNPRWIWALLGLLHRVSGRDESVDSIRSIPLRTHSLTAPYLDSDMQSRWFDYGGDTIIRADQYIRLTADRPSQRGWLFSRLPLTATNWEVTNVGVPKPVEAFGLMMQQIEVEFSIHGAHHLFGDGMAMWLTKQRGISGPVFGSTDQFEGLGIFFDTYKNNRPGVQFPYVMAMLGDGHTAYDHGNDGKANELAGCSAQGLRSHTQNAQSSKVRLTYYQDSYLKLELQYKDATDWTECFKLTSVTIPSVAYLGFSAETGELSENHDIIRLEAKNLYEPNPPTPQPAADDSHASPHEKLHGSSQSRAQAGQGWGWFFIKVIFVLALFVGAYAGYTFWRAQRYGSRF